MKYVAAAMIVVLLVAAGSASGGVLCDDSTHYVVQIGKLFDVVGSDIVEVPVTLTQYNRTEGMAGFDFLIAYDKRNMQLTEAVGGEIFNHCGWDYFRYEDGDGNTLPDSLGLVRIVGLAQSHRGLNGASSPVTAGDLCGSGITNVTLATLRFRFPLPCRHHCGYYPIRFYWQDCLDNSVWNRRFSKVLVSDTVYEYGISQPINDGSVGVPTYLGAQDTCIESGFPYALPETRLVDLYNGGVDMICSDSVDSRGDINMNCRAYEITDALLFAGYFIHGLSAFDFPDGSIAASDVNADGLTLTVPDLVYLIRIVEGDALPYPHLNPSPNEFVATQYTTEHTVGFTTEDTLGAMVLTFDGQVAAEGSQRGFLAFAAFHETDNTTKVIVYSLLKGRSLKSGVVLRYSGDGVLRDIETATYDGQPVNTTMGSPTAVEEQQSDELPTDFALSQNYPNPFNPSTTIEFALPTATKVQIWVYNVTGQRVRKLTDDVLPAGYHSIVWDGTNDGGNAVSSGVYFYRIEAGDFIQSKKMILMK